MEEITIELDLIAFGTIAFALGSVAVYYSYKGIHNFIEDPELASTKLVLKDEVDTAYQALAGSAFAFSTLTLIGAFAVPTTQFQSLQYLSEIGGFVFLLGMIAFHWQITDATKVDK